ncbi:MULTISPECIES: hypothetical protein [unclassified Micromonospora]|uniref:hypothetical protein n=1 Tax=unclassified Micromonospora TaxID=2617518 RepID=UPI0009CA0C50|nr:MULTISPECIES: hypothetical protein [unclassified Micromonospora]MDI5936923.1 hypothetical protein [Micromonospora sp. DH15]OON32192.1 hypothetical protein BSA16_07100 [Micromonospora sp. Rc5]
MLSIGPVLAFEDAVGLKVRALHDRAAHRDFIDIHAANAQLSWTELEALGARHTAATLGIAVGGRHQGSPGER